LLDALLVFSISMGYLSLLPHCFMVFDEGTMADSSERILLGEVLYRDFFSYWNPGGFWLNASLFRIAGTSVQTLRVSLSILGAIAAVGVWRLTRDHCGRLLAILSGAAVTFVCYPMWWMASSHWYSTFSAIAAAVLLRHCFEDRNTFAAPFTTGTLCGLTFVMLQPVGGFLSIAIFGVLAWDGAFFGSRAAALKRVTIFSLGVLVPIAMMYGYYAARGALDVMLYDTLLWNLEHFSPSLQSGYGDSGAFGPDSLSYEVIRWVLMVLPPFIYLQALTVAGSRYLRRMALREDRLLFALAGVGIGLLASNYYFPDVIHLAFGAPPAFALLSIMLARWGNTRLGRYPAHVITVICLIFIVFAGTFSAKEYRARCPTEIWTPRGAIATATIFEDDYRDLFSFFETHLSPDERFYVYPYGAGYNFLVGRPSAVPIPIVFPSVPTLTSKEELAAVVSALDNDRDGNQIRFVLVPFLFRTEFDTSRTVLERYILRNFEIAREGPGTLILRRHSTGNPRLKKAP
jgi:hypothetical protein